MEVDVIHAVYARVPNTPGALERAAKVLAEKRINIDAISAETLGNQGVVRILTHQAKEAVDALRKAGIESYVSEMALAYLPNQPGELARATRELAAAGLNVEGLVTTTAGHLAIRTNDVELTAQVLRKLSASAAIAPAKPSKSDKAAPVRR